MTNKIAETTDDDYDDLEYFSEIFEVPDDLILNLMDEAGNIRKDLMHQVLALLPRGKTN